MFFTTIAWSQSQPINLSWDAPTTNEDNSCLSDLSHYNVYYSNTSNSYPNFWTVDAASLSCVDTGNSTGCGNVFKCSYSTPQDMAEGTWYFVVTANDYSGNESVRSNEASRLNPYPDLLAPSAPGNMDATLP